MTSSGRKWNTRRMDGIRAIACSLVSITVGRSRIQHWQTYLVASDRQDRWITRMSGSRVSRNAGKNTTAWPLTGAKPSGLPSFRRAGNSVWPEPSSTVLR